MIRASIISFLCLLTICGFCQTNIYIVPKSDYQQRREAADKRFLYNVLAAKLLSDAARANDEEEVASIRKCTQDVQSYYLNMSEYPVIRSGVHEVHMTDGSIFCGKSKVSVGLNGKVVWVQGKDKFYDVSSGEPIKNGRTKIVLPLEGKSYFMDVYFIYD